MLLEFVFFVLAGAFRAALSSCRALWGNCSDLRGSADYSAYCGGATEHGISTANRFRPLKREQLPSGPLVCKAGRQRALAGCLAFVLSS